MTEAHIGHDRRWAIRGVLSVCLTVVIMGNTILNVALRRIQQDLRPLRATCGGRSMPTSLSAFARTAVQYSA